MIKCSKAEVRRLKTALHWKLPPAQRERIQMVLWREIGMTQPAIAEGMGVSLSTVNRAHMAYDQGGIKALKPKPNGGRKRENMSLAEEKAFLARFATAAGAGEMLNIHDLKAAYEQEIEAFDEAERDLVFWFAVDGDAVPVTTDHLGEALVGSEPLPFEAGPPVLEETPRPTLAPVVPEL